VSNFFAVVSSKIIALADPILSQPDLERKMVSPPAGAYIPSFTIYHILPDLTEERKFRNHRRRNVVRPVLAANKTFSAKRTHRSVCENVIYGPYRRTP
jgi:hypothetical protein